MFDEHKAAQVAAWFLRQAGGSMPHLKLMKLMYLAERECLKQTGYPLTGDRLVSMKHGPVLSATLEHINGEVESRPKGGWDDWIADRANHTVSLVQGTDLAPLDHLSEADLQMLQEVWQRVGHLSKYALRDHTHELANCPEWTDPGDSMRPIRYRDLFCHLGYTPEQADLMAAEIAAQSALDTALHTA